MGSESNGWREWSVAELASKKRNAIVGGPFGSNLVSHDYTPTGVPVIRGQNLSWGGREVGGEFVFVSDDKADSLSANLACAGDLILTQRGNAVLQGGQVAIVPTGYYERYVVSQSQMKMTPDPNLADSLFLYYVFKSQDHQSYLRNHAIVTGVPHTNLRILREYSFPLPPLWEQRAIASILGALDDKIELNRQMNATLESMAQALFKSWFVEFDPVIDNALAAGNPIPEPLHARAAARQKLADQRKPLPKTVQNQFPDRFVFTDELGWVPEQWEITTFGRVSNCFDSKRVPLSKKEREEKKPGDIPYHGATSVMDYINEWIFDDVYLLVGEDGSVINSDGSPFVQYIWGKAWVNNHAHVLQGANGVATEHLLLFIRSQDMNPYVTGAVQLKINQKNLNSIPFLNAPGPINSTFARRIDVIYEKIRLQSAENAGLTTLRDTLLPKLVSGQLRIPDAEKLVADAV